MTASVSELFTDEEAIGSYRRSDLWRHLVSVGICARMIAMRRNLMNFEDMFLAGLLHDIGIILEDQHLHEGFCEVMQNVQQGKTLAETECSVLGFDHAALGEAVATTWGFPDAVKATILHHHSSVRYRGPHINVVRCVEVANLICTLKGIPSIGHKLVKFSAPAVAGLSLTKEDIAVLAADLDQELSSNASLFKM
jgi:putative nucleotidyltransferase with HDIG domain